MTTKITTESGAVYELDDNAKHIRRTEGTDGNNKRRDGSWIYLIEPVVFTVGLPMYLFMEPLGDGDFTFRVTTRVVSIEEVPE